MFVLGYGLCRIFIEFFREPDAQFADTIFASVHMGQLLSLPMVLGGAWLILNARSRQVEPPAAGPKFEA